MSDAALEMMRRNGWRVRRHNGQLQLQCSDGVVALRVKTDDPAVVRAVESVIPAGAPRFVRLGENGFTALFRGKVKSIKFDLVDDGQVEMLANGEWINVPEPSDEGH